MSDPAPTSTTNYDALGGDPFFRTLVDDFYQRVEADSLLRPLFPAHLDAGKEKSFLFLTQYFGGPPRYSVQYGHPRLRGRHLPFPIGQRERDRWLHHMLETLDRLAPPEPIATEMRAYFANTSQFMINRSEGIAPEFPSGLPVR